MLQRIVMLPICALLVAAPAYADTAAPFTAAFGRLVEPGAPAAQAATVTIPTAADDPAHRAAIDCLALAINYEAGHEPAAGQAAVAEVILNRLRHPAFPKTVCGVVYQGSERRTGCQFSFTCDGSLARRRDPRIWQQAIAVATQVLDGQRAATVGRATHYHADYVNPYWAPALTRVAVIGRHIFYRFPGAEVAATGAGTAPPAATAVPSFAPWGLPIPLPVPSPM